MVDLGGTMVKHLGVAGVMGLACLAMATTWQTPWVYPLLLAAFALMGLIGRDRLDLGFYALGLTLGAGIDVAQSGTGVTVYAAPAQLLFLPLFVFFYWGIALVAVRHLVALMPPATFHPSDAVLFAGSVGLSLLANQAPLGVAIAMLALLAIRLVWARQPHDLSAALMGMLLGPGSESVLVSHGLYAFPSSHGALLPLWLFALYACVGLASRGLVAWMSRELSRLGRRVVSFRND